MVERLPAVESVVRGSRLKEQLHPVAVPARHSGPPVHPSSGTAFGLLLLLLLLLTRTSIVSGTDGAVVVCVSGELAPSFPPVCLEIPPRSSWKL